MKTFVVLLLAILLGAWTHGGSVSSGINYYISSSGNDASDGLTPATAWASPNHSVNCGDIINAAAGAYSSSNFVAAKWGTVSNCPSANGIYFAKVACVGPDVSSCSINDTTINGMNVSKSNWAVVGWIATSSNGGCFTTNPAGSATIHHIAFVNVIANGCQFNGVTAFTNTIGSPQFGVDYLAIVGVIAFNAAQGTVHCYSGVSIYEPANIDTKTGTHIYVAGVFAFGNIDPITCESSGNSDGEGIIFDNWNHSQQAGVPYTGQGVIEQSLLIGNGSNGIQIFQNTSANVYIQSSTTYGNMLNSTKTGTFLGEFLNNGSFTTSVTNSIFQATVQTISGNPNYATYIGLGDATDTVSGNYIFGVAGNNEGLCCSGGFAYGANTQATPNFVSPAIPSSVPNSNCTGKSTTTSCMSATIANFVPQAVGAIALGYQSPGPCAANSLFPIWLKGIVPNGIITKPCGM